MNINRIYRKIRYAPILDITLLEKERAKADFASRYRQLQLRYPDIIFMLWLKPMTSIRK